MNTFSICISRKRLVVYTIRLPSLQSTDTYYAELYINRTIDIPYDTLCQRTTMLNRHQLGHDVTTKRTVEIMSDCSFKVKV